MPNLKSLVAASAALAMVPGVSANVIVKRNEEPAQPSCTNFTPFVYAGCFQDPSSPERALLYNSNLPTQNSMSSRELSFPFLISSILSLHSDRRDLCCFL